MDKPEIKIVITAPEREAALRVFNPNAFPNALASVVDACSLRFSLLTSQAVFLHEESNRDMANLELQLCHALSGYADFAAAHSEVIAVYEGIGLLRGLHGFLSTMKSLLDVYAQLCGKLIHSNQTWTFKRARVEGDELSGGKFINWLRCSAPNSYQSATQLAEVISAHSHQWITVSVKYRDAISHYSEIRGFRFACVRLSQSPPWFDPARIVPASMPNGQSVATYAVEIEANLRKFLHDTISLLPGVNGRLIETAHLLISTGRKIDAQP